MVAYQQRNRCLGSFTLDNAGQNLTRAGLVALGEIPISAGLAPIEIGMNVGFVHAEPRGATIDYTANRSNVQLTKRCDTKQMTQGLARDVHLSKTVMPSILFG